MDGKGRRSSWQHEAEQPLFLTFNFASFTLLPTSSIYLIKFIQQNNHHNMNNKMMLIVDKSPSSSL
jgi:hypothetical protein